MFYSSMILMVISMVCDTLLDTILGHTPALKIGVAFKRTNHSRRKKLVTALSINLVEVEEKGSENLRLRQAKNQASMGF